MSSSGYGHWRPLQSGICFCNPEREKVFRACNQNKFSRRKSWECHLPCISSTIVSRRCRTPEQKRKSMLSTTRFSCGRKLRTKKPLKSSPTLFKLRMSVSRELLPKVLTRSPPCSSMHDTTDRNNPDSRIVKFPPPECTGSNIRLGFDLIDKVRRSVLTAWGIRWRRKPVLVRLIGKALQLGKRL